MIAVTAGEAALVEAARAIVTGEAPAPAAAPVGATISPAAATLIADALAQAWPALWRRGAVVGARPWQGAPIPLRFGPPTLALLRWLVAPSSTPLVADGPLALGDEVAIYLALAAAEPGAALAAQPLVRASPLAWLGFAAGLGAAAPGAEVPAFDALAEDPGAAMVAALAPEIARRWRDAERGKRGAPDLAAVLAIGRAQDATLEAWLAACDRRHRRALAGFVLDAAAPGLAAGHAPIPGPFPDTAPLAERTAARHGAGALLRGVRRWAAWDAEHRGVRFIDDDYADAQRLLARFEVIGRAGADLAERWLAELSALPS